MPDNRLTTLNAVHLSETTKDWAEALNDNFAELDERKTDIGNTATLVHDGSYVHTDNNFTDAYKAKLDEAEQNVQSDWNQSDSTADDYIKNKPENLVQDASYVHTDNNYTTAEKNKLAGVATGAQVNVLEGVKVNGTALTPTNKVVDVTVPTKVSDLTNDEGYTKVEASSANGKIKIDGVDTTVYTEPADVMHDGDVPSWALESTKPSYTAAEVGAIATTAKGAANGVAELDSTGKVPSTQLPSYVDDVLEYASTASFPATGESGKIYVAIDTNKTYRWTGTQYVEISESLALGETSSTAFAGDKGKVAYDHATDPNKVSTAVTSGLYKVAVTSEGHIASTAAVQKSDLDSVIGNASSSADGLMSSTDKSKLDGISAGANKVEASNTNGNIKIDGVEVPVYVAPVIDQVTEYSFTSDDSRWGALSSGVYTLTIPSTKRPFICYNGNGEQVMATIGYNGTNITVKTDTKFAGKVLAI